jgi:hypothetical protein
MSTISKDHKISILKELINSTGLIFNDNKLEEVAIDLAQAIDELRLCNVNVTRFDDALDNTDFLAEHWERRAKFLRMVYVNWPQILFEAGLQDCEIFEDINVETNEFFGNSPQKPTIFQTYDIFEEADCIFEILRQNREKTVCIVTPNKTFHKILMERSGEKTHIVHPRHSRLYEADVVVISNMVEQIWNYGCQGSYWLHDSIRKKLSLRTNAIEKHLNEHIFQYLIHNNKEVFITLPLRIKGSDIQMSKDLYRSILKHKWNILKYTSRNAKHTKPYELKKIHFRIPEQISAKDVELLATDPYDFYILKCLNLHPVSYSDEPRALRRLYKTFLHGFLEGKKEIAEAALSDIAHIDFYRYQHCRNMYSWLQKNCLFLQEQQNIRNVNYEYELGGVRLYADIDMIIEGKVLFFRMFSPKISAHNIMNGKNCAPMVSCLIADRASGICINGFQIWDMHGLGEEPIDISNITIGRETLDSFEEMVKGILSNCVVDTCQKSDRYRHFKRI